MPNRDIPEAMADRLIVALDVPTIEGARRLAGQLDGIVSFFKIGLWLLFAPGAERFIDTLIARDKRVFLDAKIWMTSAQETVRCMQQWRAPPRVASASSRCTAIRRSCARRWMASADRHARKCSRSAC